MARFIETPKYEFIDSDKFCIILEGDLVYYSDILDQVITVYDKFKSDGNSSPRFYWSVMPPFGKYLRAALVHDFLCDVGNPLRPKVDFKLAAKVFKEALEVCGVGYVRRNVMYQIVRWAGPRFGPRD